jgi:hypothetical protein
MRHTCEAFLDDWETELCGLPAVGTVENGEGDGGVLHLCVEHYDDWQRVLKEAEVEANEIAHDYELYGKKHHDLQEDDPFGGY